MGEEPAKHPGGRPSDYTEETAASICAQISAGLSLRSVCQQDGMPDKSTVFRWLARHPEFSDHYARAMENRTHALAEEILEISDEASGDFVETEDGRQVFNGEAVQRSKLRVDTRKWLMSKMAPKKYGDKITQEVTGKDGEPLSTGPTIIFSGAPGNSSPPQTVGGASKRGD